ncbi:MAG: HupE/UreJ family protein [Planctomycetota bacterium]|nr:HupE/UreJ family protein [Planctomycetota bacterium]MDG2142121.1 HupE/UreJ family protein [Planctomycetota bacterium]
MLAHEDSISSSTIELAPTQATVTLHFQALSLQEVLPLDQDKDDHLTPQELQAQAQAAQAYLLEHYTLTPNGTAATPTLDPETTHLPLKDQWLITTLEFPLDPKADNLAIQVSLFQETSPTHKDFCQLALLDGTKETWIFSRSDPTWNVTLEVPAQGATFTTWANLGFQHLLAGPDHILFVLGLLLASATPRSLVATITAFTVAHSVSLLAATSGWVVLPAGLVEPLIAASVAYVGIANLRAKAPRRTWPEALVFGLIHGLGFATLLRENLAAETSIALPLLGFNLGIEVGQLLVALVPLGLILLVERGRQESSNKGLCPRPVVQIGSFGIAIAGLAWLATRLIA